mmetsp:Transcript_34305/g.74102  ORF Transcript_34305/g.74102 Transcript_34305/m.74102 type:complete len:942 (+) Transcript_34305:96-2921(+)|eukprot:CAMPEP_0206499080 /NCGR_PEP_ID=MMETSP0324_2-20121206/51476_1 /ASSEMBLY_ACC=CAM_ASM_000836 /TAXON_ID=2866 /ORGANISM="Crypthecodinium cohnii, Strain Seligo" /LENGTH=941 /DNA_ID=CAMNT_0053985589 /DNA_START=21 /DNA_END=2846 /DNA_ORIENTATION=-
MSVYIGTETSSRHSVVRGINDLKETDICFVLDGTASMEMKNTLILAKETIKGIVNEVKRYLRLLEDGHVRVAIVVFRDKDVGDKVVELKPFTNKLDDVIRWLDAVEARGGADTCEDVLSGLKRAANLNWTGTTKVLYLITQTPAHGSLFHTGIRPCSDIESVKRAAQAVADHVGSTLNPALERHLYSNVYDLYSSEPQVQKWQECMKTFQDNGICLVGVSTGTDLRMYEQMRRWYCADGVGWPLDIVDFKSDPNDFIKLIAQKTKESCTASTLTLRRPKPVPLSSSLEKTGPPDWSTSQSWLKLTGKVRSFRATDNFRLQTVAETEHTFRLEGRVFAYGAMRKCYALVDELDQSKWVAKVYLQHNDKQKHEGDMRSQAVSQHIAESFSRRLGRRVDFIEAKLLLPSDRKNFYAYIAIEPFIDEDYTKYTSNAGYVGEDSELAEAFSHFSWEASRQSLLVTDIQGGKFTFTDPQIHAANPCQQHGFGQGNMGHTGICRFFLHHQCGDICRKVGNSVVCDHPVSAELPSAPQPALGSTVKVDQVEEEALSPFLDCVARDAQLALERPVVAEGQEDVFKLAGMQVQFNKQGQLYVVSTSDSIKELGLRPGTFIHEVNGEWLARKHPHDCLTLLSQPKNRFVLYWSHQSLVKCAAAKELCIRLKSGASALDEEVDNAEDRFAEAGITLVWKEGPAVVDIEETSAAQLAGMKHGSRISSINGELTTGKSRGELIALLKCMKYFSHDDDLLRGWSDQPHPPFDAHSDVHGACATGHTSLEFAPPDRSSEPSSHHAAIQVVAAWPESSLSSSKPLPEHSHHHSGDIKRNDSAASIVQQGPIAAASGASSTDIGPLDLLPQPQEIKKQQTEVQEEQEAVEEQQQQQEEEEEKEERKAEYHEENDENTAVCKVCNQNFYVVNSMVCSAECRELWETNEFERILLLSWEII